MKTVPSACQLPNRLQPWRTKARPGRDEELVGIKERKRQRIGEALSVLIDGDL